MKPMKIETQLLSKMAEYYYLGQGVSHRILCQITPAYSQRFGDWRKHGIMVRKKSDGHGGFLYSLETDPRLIDWDNFRVKFRMEVPIIQKPRTNHNVKSDGKLKQSVQIGLGI